MTKRTDLHRSGQRGDRVIGRVARLPLSDDARLTLLHVIPQSLPARARARAERDARKALTTEVQDLARRLPEHVAIRSVVSVGAPAGEIARCASSVKAELIVMGRGGGHHAIVCGYGRVGSIVCELLERHEKPFVVIEEDLRIVESLRARGVTALLGDAGMRSVLDRAHLRSAPLVILCIPERMAVRRALEHAREVSNGTTVLARTHSFEDRAFLQDKGVSEAVIGELELALELGRRTLACFEIGGEAVERSIEDMRRSVST